MKLCAVTMVYKDQWALSQWYAHYGALIGFENLYIVTHGRDDWVRENCPDASVLQVPRDDLEHFDKIRGQMLNAFQDGLNQYYDWVIRTDADELVCFDPHQHTSLQGALARVTSGAAFALGFDLLEFEQDKVLESNQSALQHRRNAVFTGHYSKVWAVRNRIGMKLHGARMRTKLVPSFPFEMLRGVYLAHLKFANGAALIDTNQTRSDVANREGRGLPGAAWRDPDAKALRKIQKAQALPLLDWVEAVERAWSALQDPVRDPKAGVLRARSLNFPFRTELPDWFRR